MKNFLIARFHYCSPINKKNSFFDIDEQTFSTCPNMKSHYLPFFYSQRFYSNQDQHHLDSAGFIKYDILEKRTSFLQSHGMLENKIIFQKWTVYENNHLYNMYDLDQHNRTNIQRMQNGLCPLTQDGDFITIHHLSQTHSGDWIILPQQFHREYNLQLHSNVTTADKVNHKKFNQERFAYWQHKAQQIILTQSNFNTENLYWISKNPKSIK